VASLSGTREERTAEIFLGEILLVLQAKSGNEAVSRSRLLFYPLEKMGVSYAFPSKIERIYATG